MSFGRLEAEFLGSPDLRGAPPVVMRLCPNAECPAPRGGATPDHLVVTDVGVVCLMPEPKVGMPSFVTVVAIQGLPRPAGPDPSGPLVGAQPIAQVDGAAGEAPGLEEAKRQAHVSGMPRLTATEDDGERHQA